MTLDLDDQQLLRVAAFGWSAFHSQDMADWLKESGIFRENGGQFSPKFIYERRDFLESQGFIKGDSSWSARGKSWAISPELRDSLNQDAQLLPLYSKLALSARKALWPDVRRWEFSRYCFKSLLCILQAELTGNQKYSARLRAELIQERSYWDDHNFPLTSAGLIPPLLEILLPPQRAAEGVEVGEFIIWLLQTLKYHAITEFRLQEEIIQPLLKLKPEEPHREVLEDLQWLLNLYQGKMEKNLDPRMAPVTWFQKGIRGLSLKISGLEAEGKEFLDSLLVAQSTGTPKGSEFFHHTPLFPFQALWYITKGWAPIAKFQSWYTLWFPEYAPQGKMIRSLIRQQGKADAFKAYIRESTRGEGALTGLAMFIDLLAAHWLEVGGGLSPSTHLSPSKTGGLSPSAPSLSPPFLTTQLINLRSSFRQQGYHWLAFELGQMIKQRDPSDREPGDWEAHDRASGLITSFSELVTQEDLWRVKLDKLAALKIGSRNRAVTLESEEVLCWFVDPQFGEIVPTLRKQNRQGGWSKPKPISLRTLLKGVHPSIREEDRPVIQTIVETSWDIYFKNTEALVALVDHSRIFLRSQDVQEDRLLTLKARDIKLISEEKDGVIHLRLSDPLVDAGTLEEVGQDIWQVLRAPQELLKVAEVVGLGFTLPQKAKKELAEVLGNLAESISVESPLLGDNSRSRRQDPDSRPLVELVPQGAGFALEIWVSPLGEQEMATRLDPRVRPGEGARQIHKIQGGEIILTERDLRQEILLLRELFSRCPTLEEFLPAGFKTSVSDPAEALEIMEELHACGDLVRVLWPQGGKINIRSRVNSFNTTLKVTQKNNWFELTGETQLENKETLDLRALLELLPKAQGRFIPLGDQEFLSIEAQLLRQLDQLWRVSAPHHQGLKLSPAALLVSPLLQDRQMTKSADASVEKVRDQFARAFDRHYPLPPGLSADLRPYQEEGFQWLSKLAAAGAGACLADDMGLGKTIQAIALLSSRRDLGPSLVLAPASVAPNWVSEIYKFSTDLNPVLLSPTDRFGREGQLEALRPGDVLVTTYGLLVSEAELLQKRTWNILVLDEAHALKNVQAQRTKSVFALGAHVRLALTGTPIQNHLGELWSLFEILNPGLLGSKKDFRDRFISPIEELEEEKSRQILKNVVRPFLLRRTKNQVLQDLPPKTEITLALPMNPLERSWYEAVQLKGLEDLAKYEEDLKKGKGSENQIRFLVLALLTKLRRACCHPNLAGGDYQGTTAKMDKLMELLEELKENGHRALIFSQFTDHLALIRQALEAQGITFEYLDGATPMKERTLRIARFQGGSTMAFLISLGAGGVGLNLTGADYVIHMDPWWNPAVEDQASDRAHRIGQTRPVTVYRLMSENTIEQKILDLHRRKRDLADALLEGSEASGRIGAKELLELVRG